MAKDNFAVKLSRVKTEKVNYIEPEEVFITSFDENNLHVGFGFYFTHDSQQGLVCVHLNSLYDYGDEASGNLVQLLDYKGYFEFMVHDLKKHLTSNGGNLNLPDYVLAKLLEISISTARGIIIAKTAGSFINQYYLPVFDSEKLLEELAQS